MIPAGFYYRRRFYRQLTWLAAFAIIAVSSVPNLPQPEIQANGQGLRLDYFFHFLVYFFPAFTAVIWLSDREGRLGSGKFILLLLSGLLFGTIDEFHQIYIPGRRFNPLDLLFNAAGFITGTLITYHWFVRHVLIRKNRFPLMRKSFSTEASDYLVFSPTK